MKKINSAILVSAAASIAFACTAENPQETSDTGGGSSSLGGSPPATSGGATSAGSGGAPSAGTSSASAGGGAGPGAGSGGGSSAGQSGSAGAAGAGGGSSTASPSAGCAKAGGRPADGVVVAANDHYFTFPASYDGVKPFPVLIGFHGCGEGNRGSGTNATDTEWIKLTKGTDFETNYVRFVPVSSSTGGCWTYGTDIARVTKAYDDLVANYCVDTDRVFGTGHSSGSQFVVQILLKNHTADAQHLGFKGVAPVAASDYGAMTGPIPVMYIQGKMDQERNNGDGHETVQQFRTANSCGSDSTPYSQVAGCQSGNTQVNPGCVSYSGCMAPTIWCSHNDPQYGGTMHGVPCFGVKAMYDFFESLP